jgi:hypothetical protein
MAKQSKKNRKGPKPAKIPNTTITVERPKIERSPMNAEVLKRKYALLVGQEEADALFNEFVDDDADDETHR